MTEFKGCVGAGRAQPAEVIVLDANILIRATLGRRVRSTAHRHLRRPRMPASSHAMLISLTPSDLPIMIEPGYS